MRIVGLPGAWSQSPYLNVLDPGLFHTTDNPLRRNFDLNYARFVCGNRRDFQELDKVFNIRLSILFDERFPSAIGAHAVIQVIQLCTWTQAQVLQNFFRTSKVNPSPASSITPPSHRQSVTNIPPSKNEATHSGKRAAPTNVGAASTGALNATSISAIESTLAAKSASMKLKPTRIFGLSSWPVR